MKKITSKDNKLIKLVKKLTSSAKFRRSNKAYTVEGIRICGEAIQSDTNVKQILISDDAYDKYYDKICKTLDNFGNMYIISNDIMKYISDTDEPQGMICICEQKENQSLTDIKIGAGKFVILENIQDPSNLGTILRTMEAFNISNVILTEDCCDIYNPKVLRGSMGAIFRLNFFITDDIIKTIDYLNENGITVVAGVPDRRAVSIRDIDKKLNLSVVIGNEGNGLRQGTISKCQIKATIPMAGRAESLNASTAASIMIWELMCK